MSQIEYLSRALNVILVSCPLSCIYTLQVDLGSYDNKLVLPCTSRNQMLVFLAVKSFVAFYKRSFSIPHCKVMKLEATCSECARMTFFFKREKTKANEQQSMSHVC